jgi:hypothetical protein
MRRLFNAKIQDVFQYEGTPGEFYGKLPEG